jgi:hypothetical protein
VVLALEFIAQLNGVGTTPQNRLQRALAGRWRIAAILTYHVSMFS